MTADLSKLRAALPDWGARVVADAARTLADDAPKDRSTQDVGPHAPQGARRKPAEGRVAGQGGLRARVRFTTYGWRWQSSHSARPFAPSEHHRLNGLVFERWDHPRLRNATQPWLRTTHFHPGDHKGCRCRAPSAPAPADMGVWRPVVQRVWQRAVRAAAKRQKL